MTSLSECSQGSIAFPVQWEFNVSLFIKDAFVSKKLISHRPNISHWKVIALIYFPIGLVCYNSHFPKCSILLHQNLDLPREGFTTWLKSQLIYWVLFHGFNCHSFKSFRFLSPASRPGSLLHGCPHLGFCNHSFQCILLLRKSQRRIRWK